AGLLLEDLLGLLPLEAAVVPLDQIRFDLRDGPEAAQFARPRGPLQRAGEDGGECVAPEFLADLAGAGLTGLVQRQVGAAGVLARVGPGRVAVPGEEQSRHIGRHAFLRTRPPTRRDTAPGGGTSRLNVVPSGGGRARPGRTVPPPLPAADRR